MTKKTFSTKELKIAEAVVRSLSASTDLYVWDLVESVKYELHGLNGDNSTVTVDTRFDYRVIRMPNILFVKNTKYSAVLMVDDPDIIDRKGGGLISGPLSFFEPLIERINEFSSHTPYWVKQLQRREKLHLIQFLWVSSDEQNIHFNTEKCPFILHLQNLETAELQFWTEGQLRLRDLCYERRCSNRKF